MEKKLRVALIGFGGMGQIYAGMLYSGLVERVQLVGVCCRNAAGQVLLREAYPGVNIYPDAEQMAASAGDYDAVVIVTPHVSHIPLGLKFAELGKHILLDKPAGICAGEVQLLVDKTREKVE